MLARSLTQPGSLAYGSLPELTERPAIPPDRPQLTGVRRSMTRDSRVVAPTAMKALVRRR